MVDNKSKQKIWMWAIIALVMAIGLKAWLVGGKWVPFNADEAVVALMARHILQGNLSVFFYGQAYMGSLDALLVAGAFSVFGQNVWVIRLVQSFLYLGVMITTFWLGKRAFGSWQVGVLAMFMLAIPTVNVTLYTTASLGGYGEALLLGNLTVLCGMRIGDYIRSARSPGPYKYWLGLGFLSGLGFWAFSLTLVFSLPIFLYLMVLTLRLFRFKKDPPAEKQAKEGSDSTSDTKIRLWDLGAASLILIIGWLLGSSPWWGYALTSGLENLLSESSGSAIAGVEQLTWIYQVGKHIVNLVLLGSTVILGFRPPWDAIWLALPILPFILFFWMMVIAYIARSLRRESAYHHEQWVLVSVILIVLVGFILTPFGADPSGRYFLPLVVPLSLFASAMILDLVERFGKWAYGLVALLLFYHLWGTIQCAFHFPPGITTQFYAPTQVDHRYDPALIDFLHQEGETRGYGNYWVAYPLAFLSQESLIFVPRLPYHLDFRYSERDDRYAPFDELVAQSNHVAYITTNHPALDERLCDSFSSYAVTWKEIQIGDYHVFYDLSEPTRPNELGLGETTNP